MILPSNTTVAVADGTRLRLFRNKGHEPHVELIEMPSPDVDAANQGSGGRHRSSSANPDGHRLGEDDFAAAASRYLNTRVLAGHIEALYIVADPRTLGEMRRHYHQALSAKLVGELARDLAGRPADDIEAALRKA